MQIVKQSNVLPSAIVTPLCTVKFVRHFMLPYPCSDLSLMPNIRIAYENTVTGERADFWARVTASTDLLNGTISLNDYTGAEGMLLLNAIDSAIAEWATNASVEHGVEINFIPYLPKCRTPLGNEFKTRETFAASLIETIKTTDVAAKIFKMYGNKDGYQDEPLNFSFTWNGVTGRSVEHRPGDYENTLTPLLSPLAPVGHGYAGNADGTVYHAGGATNPRWFIFSLPSIFDENLDVLQVVNWETLDTVWLDTLITFVNGKLGIDAPVMLTGPGTFGWYTRGNTVDGTYVDPDA